MEINNNNNTMTDAYSLNKSWKIFFSHSFFSMLCFCHYG